MWWGIITSIISDQHCENMNTIKSNNLDSIDLILNTYKSCSKDEDPFEQFKTLKAKIESPTIAESCNTTQMITNLPDPSQTKGFPLPSVGTHCIPNQIVMLLGFVTISGEQNILKI